ncbi:Hypothetical predicted protein [Paramuricea clavata]|uniref:Uncharacterized protein n=1 Tax=Paramuricea clavata TaxID=317549 RepID=A0A6S7IY29_PARCT|nr:Hypothetical predicted protein [Paramuricea clavata]
MDELSDWMLTFKGKLDDTTSAKVFQTLKANSFNTRPQLKLLTREQIDVMFQTELFLGAKSLLLYKLGVLRENSPLQPIANTRKKIQKNEEESSQARKNVLSALQSQADVLKDKMENQCTECRELQMNIDSMDIVVRPLEAVGKLKVVCGHCHHKGHRNQGTNPCRLTKCTDYTYCGVKEKHPEYFQKLNAMKMELSKRKAAINDLDTQVASMENFSTKSEYHFMKNLTPRMFGMDSFYKINQAKLLRDVRILRTALDGKIPDVMANDAEQLRILLKKCKRDMKDEVNASFSSDEEMESNFDDLYTNNNTQPEEISNKTSSLCVKDRKRKNTARKAKRSVKDEENHHLLVTTWIRAGITMSNQIACLRGIILVVKIIREISYTHHICRLALRTLHLCLT